jgi:membrane protein
MARFSRLLKIFTGTNSGAGDELLHLEGRLERFVHFWTLTARHFVNNRCLVRAEALAYTTLLAFIPLLAVAVAITSTLLKSQGEDQIYHMIDRFVSNIMPPATITNTTHVAIPDGHPGWPGLAATTNGSDATNFVFTATNSEAATNNPVVLLSNTNAPEDARVVTAQKEAARSIHAYIQNALNNKIGVAGMVVFVVIAIGMLRRVEETFNDIWGVTQGRTWRRQISNHFTIIVLGPVLLITATTLASGRYLHATHFLAERMPVLGSILQQLLPLTVLWLTFALLYMFVPNTHVKFSAALIGGLTAGTLWHLNNAFAFFYVSRVITNSEIYGKLGLVPVFMLGLYLSWVIVLFGAQVAYSYQNRAAYLQDKIADNVNQRGREFVALRIMTLLGQRFQNGLPPASVVQLSDELGVPSRLAQRILRTLAAAKLVTEVAGDEGAYAPARPLEMITAHDILSALRTGSGRELPVGRTPALAAIYGDFARIEAAERAASEKISVQALVQHLPAQLTLEAIETARPLPAEKAADVKEASPAKPVVTEQKVEPVLPAEALPVEAAPVKVPEPETPQAQAAEPPQATTGEAKPVKPEAAPEVPPATKPVRRETVRPGETEFPL